MYKIGDIFYEGENYIDHAIFCKQQNNLHIQEIEPDEEGKRRFQIVEIVVSEEEAKRRRIEERSTELKAELAKVKEDIEQVEYGLVRDDYAEKKARAAEIINELRVLEGKEPRAIKAETR